MGINKRLNDADFYPRPPRGGRPSWLYYDNGQQVFLPTPSARRATSRVCPTPISLKISTHALREEGDIMQNGDYRKNPKFLPTPSARRATCGCAHYNY